MEGREGYKNTKLGWIPEDWDVFYLGDVSEFKNGKAHEKEIDENGDYIVVNSKFISTNGKVIKRSNQNLCPLIPGTIVMVMSDIPNGKALSKCFFIDKKDIYTLNQRIGSVSATKADNVFLFYVLDRNKYYLKFDNGVGQTNLKKGEVLRCPIPLPPLPEQQKIAEILTTVDDKISSIQDHIQQTQLLKKGLMEKLLTEGIGHTEFKDTKIGKMAKSWKIFKMFDVLDKIQDGNYGADYPKVNEMLPSGIPFLTSTVITKDSRIDKAKLKFISNEKHTLLKKAHIKELDVIFTNRGANVGAVAITPNYLNDANIGPQLTLLRCNRSKIFHLYLLYFTQSLKFQKQIESVDSGSAMNFLSIKTTGNFSIACPSIEEQNQIATILSTVDDKLDTLESKKDQYETLKKGLMQQLLTGERRVKL